MNRFLPDELRQRIIDINCSDDNLLGRDLSKAICERWSDEKLIKAFEEKMHVYGIAGLTEHLTYKTIYVPLMEDIAEFMILQEKRDV
jgi:hypothetical protein